MIKKGQFGFSLEPPRRTKRKRMARAVERAIYEKHKGKCAICGRKIEFSDGDIDHKKPLAKGGSDRPSNLQWLCHRCNKLKGSRRTNAQTRKLLGVKKKTAKKRTTKKKTTKRKPKSIWDMDFRI